MYLFPVVKVLCVYVCGITSYLSRWSAQTQEAHTGMRHAHTHTLWNILHPIAKHYSASINTQSDKDPRCPVGLIKMESNWFSVPFRLVQVSSVLEDDILKKILDRTWSLKVPGLIWVIWFLEKILRVSTLVMSLSAGEGVSRLVHGLV